MHHTSQEPSVVHIPPSALVILIGPAATGKSTWAKRHFLPTQIVSSDACRAMVSDNEADQEASRDAFFLFYRIINDRLKRGLVTIADSTALTYHARMELLRLANNYGRPTVGLIFAMSANTQIYWNQNRSRHVPEGVLADQRVMLQKTLQHISDEEFTHIVVLHTQEEVESTVVKIGEEHMQDAGPFDIIGDVHGCADELLELLHQLGYDDQHGHWSHPQHRHVVFVGDLIDRGPSSAKVLSIVHAMITAHIALLVIGNHDYKLLRWLKNEPIKIGHTLQRTIEEMNAIKEAEQQSMKKKFTEMLQTASGYVVLDQGRLVVTHAGIKDYMVGRWDSRIEAFCLYGENSTSENGIALRQSWNMTRYVNPDAPLIVHGHTVVETPEFINETVDIDTGCCFGGSLTALRYPERTILSVHSHRTYCERRYNNRIQDDN